MLRISNPHNQGTMILAHSTEGAAIEETGKMVFHCYSDSYFLSEVWEAASVTGHKLLESRIEAELSRKRPPMVIAVFEARH